MNLFKKATATLALVSVLSGIFSTGVSAASTAEIESANYLAKAGIIVDHTSDAAAYNLDQNVLRQEIAAVARGIAGVDKKTTCDGTFKDVSATKPNDWACYSVEALSDKGLIALNENFRPEANISKAEGIGMIVKAVFGDEYKYDSTLTTTWQEQVVAFAVKNGVTENFTNYDTPATRGFVFAAGANAMEAKKSDDGKDANQIMCELLGICEENGSTGTGSTDTGATTPTATTGNVEITLNPKSPVAQTIPSSGLVPFGKFDFTAGKEDVKIDSVNLKREGLSERTDIKRVYFEKNGVRVSNRASVSIDEYANVTFTPSLTIKAGSTETLDLIVELKDGATVGAEHRFSIAANTDVVSSTTIGGTFPLRTALMRVGSYNVATVEVVPVGGSAATTPDTTYNVGSENALLSEFQLVTNGEKDNVFKSVTFRNSGDADASASLANLGIYKDGKKVSTDVSILGRDVTFYVNDTILNGRTENYELRADVTGAERTNETYQFEIRNTSDVTVVEKENGFSAPINLDRATTTAGVSLWKIVKVEGGDFLVSRDTAYTLNQTVSAATNDVVLYAAKINVKEEVSVEDVLIEMSNLATSGSLNDFSSLRLLVGDATVATYTPNTTDAAAGKFLFESNFNIKAGQTTLKVTGNLKTNVTNNSIYRVDTVKLGGTSSELRYVSNDEKVTVNGSAQGITTTVADGALTLTKNDGIDNLTIVPGASDKLVLGFAARANDVSDVKITGMKFTSNGIDESLISNVRLYQDGKLVPNATKNDFDFNSIDITIAKNTTANFEILADFSNSIATSSSFQLTLPANAVNARNLDSNKTVDTSSVTGVTFTFSDGGALKVTANSSQVQSSILTPSSSESSVFKFDLEADDDNVMVTDVFVTNTQAGIQLNEAVKSSSLYINGKSYPGAVVEANKIHFAIGSNGVIIKRDETITGDVKISLHDSQSRTNVALQLAILDGAKGVNEVSGTVNGIRALSESTGKEITRTGGDISSNKHLVARSKPTVAMSNFTASTNDVYKFTVTADGNRKITLDNIGLVIGGSAVVNGGKVTVYRDSQSNGNEMFVKYIAAATADLSDATIASTAFDGTHESTITLAGTKFVAGDTFTASVASVTDTFTGGTVTYTVKDGDTLSDVASGLAALVNGLTSVTATSAAGVITIVDSTATQTTGTPAVSKVLRQSNTWYAAGASKDITAGQTVTFYATIEGVTANNNDLTRETKITTISYKDDVTTPVSIEASAYNVGLPTTTSSYKY